MASDAPAPTANDPLISPHRSTSGLKIALHPLALLSISDYITRHTLRQNTGPIVGALLGTQQGRDIAIEQAYEVKVAESGPQEHTMVGVEGDGEVLVDEKWFDTRLKLFKDTHPTMDLLGWYSTTSSPNFHPNWKHVNTHRSLQKYNESLILLLLNPFSAGVSVGGKLPLGIYESVIEGADAQVPAHQGEGGGVLKFVPAEYTVETGEAEMIGVDFIAKGGWGNAAAVVAGTGDVGKAGPSSQGQAASQSAGGDMVVGEPEGTVKDEKTEEVSVAAQGLDFAGTQNDELLANLTAKANAIRMLHSRIALLKKYLEHLPQMQSATSSIPPSEVLPISHPLLRAIKSLTYSRLPLLIPADEKAFKQEALTEQSDVALVALLGTLTRSVEEMKEVQRRFNIVEQAGQREGPRGAAGDREGGREVGDGRRMSERAMGLGIGREGGGLGFDLNFKGLMRAAAGRG
ncbi:hypothetical protein L211DRAFT_836040 [Terfezia boudieri ATCC MYA-4762]|uniref:COP9 signalosome complex subunit 6 n=1 Tax=Terfezia boudieri ATCC MYA-4762 TaxID=1051890 RepID=A0A3N4LST5_9PEZI|nr:hypothetical protein L211DRAFT_836040 [Terfezia boudieri ATCC MYA-4762]